MATKKTPIGRIALASVALIAIGGAAAYYFLVILRDQLPQYSITDVGEDRSAGKASVMKGEVYWRPVGPEGREKALAAQRPSHANEALRLGWSKVTNEDPVYLGSLYFVPPGALLQISTSGNWLVTMDGEGEFIFEDARRSSDGKKRSLQWYVRRGTFRAKSHDWDPTDDFWIEVSTKKGRVLARRGPMGMRINEEGGGHVWLFKGEGALFKGVEGEVERVEIQPMKPVRL